MRTAYKLLTVVGAAEARALVRQALIDANLLRRGGWGGWDFAPFTEGLSNIGVEVSQGDLTFVLDFNETTDTDLADAGIREDEAVRLRTAVHALAPSMAPSRFDRWNRDDTKRGALQQLLQAARLLGFLEDFRAIGAADPVDLDELTGRDLHAIGMRGVALRRFQVALHQHSMSQRVLPHTNKTRCGDDAVGPFLTRCVRLTPAMTTRLHTYHGVESLEDLTEVRADLLRDVGAKELHQRRFQAAVSRLSPTAVTKRGVRCSDDPRTLLRSKRLGQFIKRFDVQLGAETLPHLLELKREDLIGVGLRTLHRLRFYQLQEQGSACKVESEGADSRREKRRWVRSEWVRSLRLTLGSRVLDDNVAPPPLSPAVPLFMAGPSAPRVMGVVASRAASWEPWTPKSAPMPAKHPLGYQCLVGQLRVPGKVVQDMCLNPKDHLSKHLAETGRWRDCQPLVTEWNASARHIGGGGLFLELGANIGACTLEMLLLTSARVVAFEPSQVNLFHLTRTLRWTASAHESVTHRVVVYPVGAGETALRTKMVNEKGNFGNSMLTAGQAHPNASVPTVDVYPLDALFPEVPLAMPVRLMKLDVQGFECKALLGAMAMLVSGTVHTVMAETSKLLRQHKCSAPKMRELLRLVGFSIVQTGGSGVATGSEVVTVARQNR